MSDSDISMAEEGGANGLDPEKPTIDKKVITAGLLFVVAGKKLSLSIYTYVCMNKCAPGRL